MENRKYYLNDIESGVTHEVSKETYDSIKNAWNCASELIKKSKIGRIFIAGIGAGLDQHNNELSKMFYNPKYNDSPRD